MDNQTLKGAIEFSKKEFGFEFSKVSDGIAESKLLIEKHHVNQLGIAYGGYLFNMLDVTCGIANISGGGGGPTISASTDFIRGPKEGDTIICRAHADKIGRTIAYASGEIYLPDGKLAAKMSCTFCCAHQKTPGL